MNYLSLASLLLLLCAGTQAQSVSCGLQCTTTCQLYGTLFSLPLLNELQDAAVSLCQDPCNSACSCAENCNSICSASGESCPPSFPPSVAAAGCYVRNADCIGPCLAQCAFTVGPAVFSSADTFRQRLSEQFISQIADAGTALQAVLGESSLINVDALLGVLEKGVEDISKYVSDTLFAFPQTIMTGNVQGLFNQSVHSLTGTIEAVLGDLESFDLTNATAILSQLTQNLGSLTQLFDPLNALGGLNQVLSPLTNPGLLAPSSPTEGLEGFLSGLLSPTGEQSGLLSGLVGRKRKADSEAKRSAKVVNKKRKN